MKKKIKVGNRICFCSLWEDLYWLGSIKWT